MIPTPLAVARERGALPLPGDRRARAASAPLRLLVLRRAVAEDAGDGGQRVSRTSDQDDLGGRRVRVDDVEDSVEPESSLLRRRLLGILAVDEAADQDAVIVGGGQLLDQPGVTGLVVGQSDIGGRQASVP